MTFSFHANNLNVSPLQEALLLSRKENVIPFSLGMPAEESFSIFQHKEFIEEVFLSKELQYRPPSEEIKSQIVSLMKKRGVITDSSQVFLTTGGQQGLYLILKLLCDEGDTVVVDRFTYPGFIQPAQSLGINLEPVAVDFKDGMDLNHLEDVLKKEKKPKLIYTMPDGHNPLGISLSLEKRQELIKLAESYQIPVLEDDAYGFLSYETSLPSLLSFSENVIYAGTFSKVIGPSFRIGWLVVPKEWIDKLGMMKESVDLNTGTFSQALVSSFLKNISIDQYFLNLSGFYRNKRDKMINSLKNYLPEIEFESPESGFFIWGRFLDNINTKDLFFHALQHHKVSFISSTDFDTYKKNKVENCLRLSFSYCREDKIEEGIIKIKQSIRELRGC